MCEKIFYFILDAAITAGIAAAAVIIARLFLRRAPKKWAYMMWAVVFFRCLCPFSIESGFSLFNAVENVFTEDRAAAAEPLHDSDGSANVPISFEADNAPSEIIFPGTVPQTAVTGYENGETAAVPQKSAEKEPVSVYAILFAVWVCGVTAMAVYGVTASLSLKRRIKTAVRTEDGVYESDRIATAFTAGLFCPKIYLPCGLPPEQRELIILHERVHIRRRDYILKPLAFAGLAVQWFDPLIWAAFALMTRDMEMSCDEAALRVCGTDKRTAYSEALLNASVRGSGIAAWTGFGESGIKERVKNVLEYKKPNPWVTALAAAVMLTACGAVGTDAKDAKDTQTDIPTGTAAAETGTPNDKSVQSETETADAQKEENGNVVSPDLFAVSGINGTVGYVSLEDCLSGVIPDDDKSDGQTAPLCSELLSGFDLESARWQYAPSRDDYKKLQIIKLSRVVPMVDSEGEPVDDVIHVGFQHCILGEPFECEAYGAKITVDETGNVKAVREDGSEVKVDNYVPKTVFNEVTGKVEFVRSDPVLSETGSNEAEDSKQFIYFNFGENEEEESVLSSEERAKLEEQRLREEEQAKQGQLSEEQHLSEDEQAKFMRLSEEQAKLEEEHKQLASELETSPEYQKFKEDIKSSYSKIKKPVDTEITDPYGGDRGHKGVDFKVVEGDPVCAAADGTVTEAPGTAWNRGYGNYVLIDHGKGMTTLYAHLSEAEVKVGDTVKAGDEIGKAGHTGDTYGDNLHFEVRIDDQHIDPMDYFDN